jgi:alpha-amylase
MNRWLAILTFLFWVGGFSLEAADGKVVLQGFWWDYWNNNYANNWSTYLADLAPRLREMGIDAVWIPPTVKNKNATGSVGYSPYDHYDLGDKFQGGSTGTRVGTKDNLLRAIAILHANGIEVIQDVVLNHMDGAGSDTGAGGQDPAAPANQWKNFRYVCYATPGISQDAANYGARRGRFPKNWQNFHPNPDHNTEGDDITAGFFGPDICYYSQARGLSSISSYNPPQEVNYMRNGMRGWLVWMKAQTGVDGFRFDAVKHFETWAMQDFAWNLAYNAGFASGGPKCSPWASMSARRARWTIGLIM